MDKIEKVRILRKKIQDYQLEGCGIAENYTEQELAERWNGIGPEAFPSWLRNVISFLHPSLEPVAFIHDLEWSESDCSKEKFEASNQRFKRNGYAVAKKEFSWWNPRRYLVMNQARRFGNACQLFGWQAWCAGYHEEACKD